MIKYIKSQIPFVILKSATSFDGKIATCSGESKWITSKESREDIQNLRNKLIRIIVDTNLKIPIDSRVVKNSDNLTILATTINADINKKKILRDLEVTVIDVPKNSNKINLSELVKIIGQRGIAFILIEGG